MSGFLGRDDGKGRMDGLCRSLGNKETESPHLLVLA